MGDQLYTCTVNFESFSDTFVGTFDKIMEYISSMEENGFRVKSLCIAKKEDK